MADIWDSPEELARRIAAARGYVKEDQDKFGKRIGRSGRTVRKLESGDIQSLGATPDARRRLARKIVDSGVPAFMFELDEHDPSLAERVEALEHSVGTIQHSVGTILRKLDRQAEAAIDAESDSPPDPPSAGPGEADDLDQANG